MPTLTEIKQTVENIFAGARTVLETKDFTELQIEQLPDFAKQLQTKLVSQFAPGLKEPSFHLLDPASIADLHKTAQVGARTIIRHGAQASSPEVEAISETADKKIAQMRKGNNDSDPITIHSAIDFVATMVIYKYLQAQGINIQINTSANLRAAIPATALAELFDINVNFDSTLDCVNYPAKQAGDEDDAALKQYLNNGGLPWDKAKVDTVCATEKDPNPFDRIERESEQRFEDTQCNPNELVIDFSHSQQLATACEKNDQNVVRYRTYGSLTIDNEGTVLALENGCYAATTFSIAMNVFSQKSSALQFNSKLPENTLPHTSTSGLSRIEGN